MQGLFSLATPIFYSKIRLLYAGENSILDVIDSFISGLIEIRHSSRFIETPESRLPAHLFISILLCFVTSQQVGPIEKIYCHNKPFYVAFNRNASRL